MSKMTNDNGVVVIISDAEKIFDGILFLCKRVLQRNTLFFARNLSRAVYSARLILICATVVLVHRFREKNSARFSYFQSQIIFLL